MNKISLLFFLIAIGFVLFIICISVWNEKEFTLFGGILLSYSGTIILISNIRQKENSLYGLRFRGILTGIFAIITGLIVLISYFIR